MTHTSGCEDKQIQLKWIYHNLHPELHPPQKLKKSYLIDFSWSKFEPNLKEIEPSENDKELITEMNQDFSGTMLGVTTFRQRYPEPTKILVSFLFERKWYS